MIALEAAGDDVIPGFSSAFHNGHDVVEREVLRGALLPAILAGIVVARVDICSTKFDVLEALPDLYILQETENTGHSDGKTDAPDLAIILSQNLNLALAQQIKRTLPGNYVDWFIGCV